MYGTHSFSFLLLLISFFLILQAPQPYTFGYETVDEYGNKQMRHEVSDENNFKKGSYGFMDVNGIFRHVSYVADGDGFRAKIHTNEPGTASSYSAGAVYDTNPAGAQKFHQDFAQNTVVQSEPASTVEYVPVEPTSSVEYVRAEPGSTLEFVPSVPELKRIGKLTTTSFVGQDPNGGQATELAKDATYEHPFANLREAPPGFYAQQGAELKYYQ